MFPSRFSSLSWKNVQSKARLLTVVAVATFGWYILCWISQQWKDKGQFASEYRRTLAMAFALLGQTSLIYWTAYFSLPRGSRHLVRSWEFASSCGQLSALIMFLTFLFGTPMRLDTVMWCWTHSVQMASICVCGAETTHVVKWLNQAITDVHHDQIDPKEEGHRIVSKEDWVPEDTPLILMSAFLGLVGAWFGSAVTPLDWEKWWQFYPVNTLFGAAIFSSICLPCLLFKIASIAPKTARSFCV